MAGMFGPLADLWSMAFMPFQQLGGPGLGAMADVQAYNAHNSYNPMSISSLGKIGPYTQGAAQVIGNRYGLGGGNSVAPNYGGGVQAPNNMSVAPNYQNQMKQQYTQMMINKLGQQR
jgi:hypothetical protein